MLGVGETQPVELAGVHVDLALLRALGGDHVHIATIVADRRHDRQPRISQLRRWRTDSGGNINTGSQITLQENAPADDLLDARDGRPRREWDVDAADNIGKLIDSRDVITIDAVHQKTLAAAWEFEGKQSPSQRAYATRGRSSF